MYSCIPTEPQPSLHPHSFLSDFSASLPVLLFDSALSSIFCHFFTLGLTTIGYISQASLTADFWLGFASGKHW